MKLRIIVFSVAVLWIGLIISFPFLWNRGLFLPLGYQRRDIYDQRIEKIHPLYFYESNSCSLKNDCRENTLHYPGFFNDSQTGKSFDYNGKTYLFKYKTYLFKYKTEIYIETNNSIVGEFVSEEKEGVYKQSQTYSLIFLDDHYIYYITKKVIRRAYFAIPTHTPIAELYYKYEFYRLDLDNGQNEKVKAKLFVEKINKYDDTIRLK